MTDFRDICFFIRILFTTFGKGTGQPRAYIVDKEPENML